MSYFELVFKYSYYTFELIKLELYVKPLKPGGIKKVTHT